MLTVVTSLTDLHAGPSFLDEMLTQVTNGTTLELLDERGEWRRVRQSDGYSGWAYAPYLADVAAPQANHIVSALWAQVQSDPRKSHFPTALLPVGTLVHIAEQNNNWGRFIPAGTMLPGGWISMRDLRPLSSLPLSSEKSRQQIVADARRFTGVYYLWGGATAFGLDCSGLTQVVHRLSGYAIPRDAGLQFSATRAVEPPFQPGDLLFFHSEKEKRKITHVGISTGGWNIIHSSRSRNGVYEEDVQKTPHLRDRFAGARTFLIAPQ